MLFGLDDLLAELPKPIPYSTQQVIDRVMAVYDTSGRVTQDGGFTGVIVLSALSLGGMPATLTYQNGVPIAQTPAT